MLFANTYPGPRSVLIAGETRTDRESAEVEGGIRAVLLCHVSGVTGTQRVTDPRWCVQGGGGQGCAGGTREDCLEFEG